MNRRGFLSLFGVTAAAIAADPELALWTSGAKTISIPRVVAPLWRFSVGDVIEVRGIPFPMIVTRVGSDGLTGTEFTPYPGYERFSSPRPRVYVCEGSAPPPRGEKHRTTYI